MGLKTCAAAALGVLIALFASAASAVVPAIPTVTGPVPDADAALGPMFAGIRPSLTPGHQLADFNYVTEEYWVSGTACSVPYKTRFVLRRPADMSKFSGVVVAEPLHRGGNALIFNFSRYGIMQRGHIGLEIDARSVNLNNANNALQSLQPFNPVRYGPVGNTDVTRGFVLAANNSGQANEVMAQVGRLIKTLSEPTNPLRSWPVRRMVMAGTSDASDAVRIYLAGATGAGCGGTVGHTTFRMPDDGPIYDGFFRGSILNTTPTPALADVPHIEMPTQFEVHNSNGFRKPDSDEPTNRYRLYEVSGMSHNDTRDNAGFDPSYPGGQQCDGPLSRFDFPAMYFTGLQHLIDWTDGVTPPHAPALMGVDNNTAGDGTRVATDAVGNATLGVRSPYLDVPIYRYKIPNTGPGSLCNQTSQQLRLPDATLVALHLNPRQFARKWRARVGDLLRQGWIPPEYVDEIRADAKEAWDNGPESLFWRRSDGAVLAWNLNAETPVVNNALPTLPAGWSIVGSGDFTGDGQVDLLLRGAGAGALWSVRQGVLVGQSALPALDSSWAVAAVADFDGDGRADILWRRAIDGSNVVWLMNGATVVSSADLPGLDKNWSVAGAADFDGDLKADILFRRRDGANAIYSMDGGTVRSVAPLAAFDRGWSFAALADVDGDGRADIVLHNADGSNAAWLMDGATIAARAALPSSDGAWSIAAIADYDGDGRDDLLWRSVDGSNAIWFMAGSTVKRSVFTTTLPAGWQAVR